VLLPPGVNPVAVNKYINVSISTNIGCMRELNAKEELQEGRLAVRIGVLRS